MFSLKEINFPVLCAAVSLILMVAVTKVNTAGLDMSSSDLDHIKSNSMTAGSIIKNNKSSKAVVRVTDIDEGKNSSGKRNPKFGFNMELPSIPGLTSSTMTTIRPDGSSGISGVSGDNQFEGGNNLGGAAGLGIASTALLIKSGVLGGLTAIKAAIIPPLFIGSIIIFLIAGAVFFTCNVINCGIGSGSPGGSGGFGPDFGGLPSFNNLFNRNGYDYEPVYQALDDGYKKFE